MGDKKTLPSKKRVTGDPRTQPSASLAMLLLITASDSGVTTVPMPILSAMFEKANRLLQTPSNVIPKPGASNGSFIVVGHGNTIHSVTPGKGGCLKCDRTCVNSSTRICEHVLAVAQVRGTLQEFLSWFRRSKRGPNALEMALGSGPKNRRERCRADVRKQTKNDR